MPFILANAWLASALMEFPDCAPLIWRMMPNWPVRQICVGYLRRAEKAHEASVMGRKPTLRVNLHRSPAESGKTLRNAIAEQTMETVPMNRCRFFRHAMVALVPAAAISLGLGNVLAQTPPPPAPPAVSTPTPPAPAPSATPAPAPPGTSPPGAGSPAAPGTPPATAETPPTPPPAAAPVQTADPFGEQITLTPKTVLVMRGNANWDSA